MTQRQEKLPAVPFRLRRAVPKIFNLGARLVVPLWRGANGPYNKHMAHQAVHVLALTFDTTAFKRVKSALLVQSKAFFGFRPYGTGFW